MNASNYKKRWIIALVILVLIYLVVYQLGSPIENPISAYLTYREIDHIVERIGDYPGSVITEESRTIFGRTYGSGAFFPGQRTSIEKRVSIKLNDPKEYELVLNFYISALKSEGFTKISKGDGRTYEDLTVANILDEDEKNGVRSPIIIFYSPNDTKKKISINFTAFLYSELHDSKITLEIQGPWE